MQYLFLPDAQIDIPAGTAFAEGQDHQHLAKVLRAQPGTRAAIVAPNGNTWLCVVTAVEKSRTLFQLESRADELTAPEPVVTVTVAQALGKGDKFEQVIQHGVEAGASTFVPLRTDRTVADMPKEPARAAEKVARWNQIARSAAEQSHRRRVPEVQSPLRMPALLASPAYEDGLRLLLQPGEQPLKQAVSRFRLEKSTAHRIVIAIGPEGGWSPQELQAAGDAGWIAVGLGPRVLRTETAALVAISQILYEFEM
jgi:16S rRNA (uracil1498-N3)-methyltransferase